jgi:hypothetical protein
LENLPSLASPEYAEERITDGLQHFNDIATGAKQSLIKQNKSAGFLH